MLLCKPASYIIIVLVMNNRTPGRKGQMLYYFLESLVIKGRKIPPKLKKLGIITTAPCKLHLPLSCSTYKNDFRDLF